MIAPSLALAALLALHPGSLSGSRVTVDGAGLQHELRFQALTLIESLPVDENGDLALDEAELARARALVDDYLLEHYRFFAGGPGGTPLEGRVTRMELFLDGHPSLPTSTWVEARIEYEHESALESVEVEETLFEVSNPQHLEYLSLRWRGEAPQVHVFQPGDARQTFEPTGEVPKGRLRTFFELGAEHILSGYDHLLFLAALLVAVSSLRSLAWVITAFTLAHSVTLALAALDLVSLPSRFVELAIALSIVYVAAENLMKLEKRSLWVEAFLFGLLHGLGFAGFLGDALRWEDELVVPLVGFNLGVEAGQLLVVLPLALVFAWIGRGRESGEGQGGGARLVPATAGRVASGLIVLVGLYWFGERAGFIG